MRCQNEARNALSGTSDAKPAVSDAWWGEHRAANTRWHRAESEGPVDPRVVFAGSAGRAERKPPAAEGARRPIGRNRVKRVTTTRGPRADPRAVARSTSCLTGWRTEQGPHRCGPADSTTARAYAFRCRQRHAPKLARPRPRRVSEAGSGTGVVDADVKVPRVETGPISQPGGVSRDVQPEKDEEVELTNARKSRLPGNGGGFKPSGELNMFDDPCSTARKLFTWGAPPPRRRTGEKPQPKLSSSSYRSK